MLLVLSYCLPVSGPVCLWFGPQSLYHYLVSGKLILKMMGFSSVRSAMNFTVPRKDNRWQKYERQSVQCVCVFYY